MPYADPSMKKSWTREHKDSVRASQQRYDEKNRESIRAKAKLAYAADPDKFNRWVVNNPEKAMQSRLRNSAQTRSKLLGVPFDLKLADIVVPEFCPVFGMRLVKNKGFPRDNSPTLDRTIPELGYVVGNVRVISYRANCIKSFGTADEHRAVAKYLDSL